MAKALTALAVERARPGTARREVPDGLLRGLYLVLQPSGARSWAVRYRHRGAPRKLTIGPWPAIDLATARDLGAKALRRVAEGDDPAAEKTARRAGTADTVEHVLADYIARHVRRKRTGHEIERMLRRDVEWRWRGRKIQDITRRDVIALADAIEARGAPIMANRTFEAVRTFFNWCRAKDIIAGPSPCEGVKPPGDERHRDRVLTDDELRLIWSACDVVKWPYGPQVRLLILTGCRRTEIADLRWSEVDVEGRMLRLPRERVKNDRAHEVPLNTPALAVLGRIPNSRSDFVFPSETSASSASSFSRAKRRFDAAILAATGGAIPHWTFHDIRRTVASGMARLGINLPVIEKCLNHQGGSFGGIVGIYQRHSFTDEKRAALEAWGRFVTTLVTDAPAGNVVDMRRETV
jgi:integrase